MIGGGGRYSNFGKDGGVLRIRGLEVWASGVLTGQVPPRPGGSREIPGKKYTYLGKIDLTE